MTLECFGVSSEIQVIYKEIFVGTENVDRLWPFKENQLGGCKHTSKTIHLESYIGCQAVDQTGFFGA